MGFIEKKAALPSGYGHGLQSPRVWHGAPPPNFLHCYLQMHSRFELLSSPMGLAHRLMSRSSHGVHKSTLAPRQIRVSPDCPRCGVASHRAPHSQFCGQSYCTRKAKLKGLREGSKASVALLCGGELGEACAGRGRPAGRVEGPAVQHGSKEVPSKGLASIRSDLWLSLR